MALQKAKGECIVLVTCSSPEEAGRIARALVERRLAACGNIASTPVRSIYRWKGAVESADETLLVLKTNWRALPRLEAAVKELHSYEVPECIALPIAAGSTAYLAWMRECLKPSSRSRRPANRSER